MCPRTWRDLQVAVLAAGALFAWSIVATDLYRFTLTGGDLTQFADTALPNPLLTTCFYGAIGLTVALRWALRPDRQHAGPRGERRLAWLLLAGTVFALGSLGYECYWSSARQLGGPGACTGGAMLNPLETPCLVGFLFYLAGLTVTLIVARAVRRRAPADGRAVGEPAASSAHHRVA